METHSTNIVSNFTFRYNSNPNISEYHTNIKKQKHQQKRNNMLQIKLNFNNKSRNIKVNDTKKATCLSISGNRAARWSKCTADDERNVLLRGGEIRTGEFEEKQVLLEAGGDDDVVSSKKYDLFPHTTADMFEIYLYLFPLPTAINSLSHPLCFSYSNAD